MFTKCANPQCPTCFEYHLGGRFYRFHQGEAVRTERNTHSVVHFWLCPECAELYALHYDGLHCLLVQSTGYCTGSLDTSTGQRDSAPESGDDLCVTLTGAGKGAGP